MDRDTSVSSDPSSRRRNQHHPVLPPWENRSVSQVPFMEPGSPGLVQRDEQGFFRQSSYTNHRPKLSASMSAPHVDEYSSPVSEHSTSNPWKSTAPLPPTTLPKSPPYDAPAYGRAAYDERTYSKPPFRKAASQPTQPHVPHVHHAPPTPPESESRSLRSASASPPINPATKALPGTMSSRASRNRSASQSQVKPRTKEHRSSHPESSKEDQAGLGKRFKSAFRDIFKKNPIDESQFERISDRHWTDEY
jgi:hypothetical protein